MAATVTARAQSMAGWEAVAACGTTWQRTLARKQVLAASSVGAGAVSATQRPHTQLPVAPRCMAATRGVSAPLGGMLRRPLAKAASGEPNTWRGMATSSAVSSSANASSSATTLDTLAASSDAVGAADSTVTSMLAPLKPYIEALPAILHLPEGTPHAYALAIAITTVLLRSAVTLPITLWQRRRTRRMVQLVAPQWAQLKQTLPISVAKRCRKEGKSYEAYEKELQKEVRQEGLLYAAAAETTTTLYRFSLTLCSNPTIPRHAQLKTHLKALTRQHKCSAAPTLLAPLAVHLPLFITVSLALRTALLAPGSLLAAETIPWWSPPPELQARFEASAKVLLGRGIEGDALAQLTSIRGPTLNETDKTMAGPIGLGLLSMINVELGQWLRRGMMSEESADKAQKDKEQAAEEVRRQKQAQANRSRAALASEIRARNSPAGSSSGSGMPPADAVPPTVPPAADKIDLAPIRTAVLSNTLRAAAIAFVVVSSQAPTALVVYWLSSAGYTLVQNSAFAYADWRREKGADKKVSPPPRA